MRRREMRANGVAATAAATPREARAQAKLMPGAAINVIDWGAMSGPLYSPKDLAPVRGTARNHCRTTEVLGVLRQ